MSILRRATLLEEEACRRGGALSSQARSVPQFAVADPTTI